MSLTSNFSMLTPHAAFGGLIRESLSKVFLLILNFKPFNKFNHFEALS
jgi:hypothetical protein